MMRLTKWKRAFIFTVAAEACASILLCLFRPDDIQAFYPIGAILIGIIAAPAGYAWDNRSHGSSPEDACSYEFARALSEGKSVSEAEQAGNIAKQTAILEQMYRDSQKKD